MATTAKARFSFLSIPLTKKVDIFLSFIDRSRHGLRDIQRLRLRRIHRFRVFRRSCGIHEWTISDEQSDYCPVCFQERRQGRTTRNPSRTSTCSSGTEKQCSTCRSKAPSRTHCLRISATYAWFPRSLPGPVRWYPRSTATSTWIHPSANDHAPYADADGPPGYDANADAASAGNADVWRISSTSASWFWWSVPSTTPAWLLGFRVPLTCVSYLLTVCYL